MVSKRKNEKHPVLKEEERILSLLKMLRDDGKISNLLYDKLKPIGSQPPRIYGLAKIHKVDVPLRPILSMPGSVYYKIALQVTEWLSVVDECKINASTKRISETLKEINLEGDEELISFDVSSLYTNVSVQEAISDCTELLYSGKYTKPPVDEDTFKQLLEICSCNVLMLTNEGYYRQKDGLAMGSPPAPLLANGWMSKFDKKIQGDAKMYFRYMDDILRDIKGHDIEDKVLEINELHPSLKFTHECETNSSIAFLDMMICRSESEVTSTWHTKPTDTGLTMNYHALAPQKYKRSAICGLVHRIHRACSTWKNFHESLTKAKMILDNNQYPPSFYEPIIKRTLNKIIDSNSEQQHVEKEDQKEAKLIFIQYRGRITEKFEQSLKRCTAPCKVVYTLRKVKSVLLSLKTPVEKALKSGVVYKITCPRCNSCYVGQTSRHLLNRIKEHRRKVTPVGSHFTSCNHTLGMDDVCIELVVYDLLYA